MSEPVAYSQVAACFEAICDLPPDEQALALVALEPALADQVRGLLQADAVASRVLVTRPSRGAAALLAADLASDIDPERIGPYRVLRRLGAGAMGVVYEAEQDHPRRRVALKVLRPWLRGPMTAELFRFEAQALGQVSHPAIPVVYEAGEHHGVAFLSMERVEGVDLRAWALRERPGVARAAALLAAIADAVQAAHDAGLIHRDLKPGNILVAPNDRPKLLDFGVATLAAARQRGVQPGTPVYMSPEQARGEPLDERSDVHALGTIAYELLTGRLPVEDGVPERIAALKAEPPPPATAVRPGFDRDLSDVLARALAPDPAARTPSAAAFAEDVRRAAAMQPLPWKGGGVGYRLARFTRRHRRGWLVGGAAAAGLLAAVGGAALGERRAAAAREQLAAEHAALLEEAVDAADPAEAEALLHAFARQPEHQGTRAVPAAWLRWAARASDRRQARRALAEAWLTAVTPADVEAAQVALGRRFDVEADWDALWQLEQAVSPAVAAALAEPLRRAAEARRRPPAGGPDAAALADLLTGRPVGRGARGGLFDVDGDGSPELLAVDRDAVVTDPRTGAVEWSLTLPTDVGWVTARDLVRADGRLWFADESGPGSPLHVLEVDGGVATLRPGAHLPDGGVLDLTTARTPFGERIVAALAFPERGVWWVDPVSGRSEPVSVPANDAMDVLAVDLDGDAIDELIVAWGAWSGYAVELWRAGSDGYHTVASRTLGTVNQLALLPRAGQGPLIVAAKSDLEQDHRRFGADRPYGPDPGLYLLDPADGLAIVAHLPVPVPDGPTSTRERGVTDPYVADLDGDGRLDVVAGLSYFDLGAGALTWFVFDALGERRQHVVAGVEPAGVLSLDADAADELILRDDDGQFWAVGAGGEPLPTWVPRQAARLSLDPDPPSNDTTVAQAWSRAAALARLGLVDEAASAVQSAAVLARRPEVVAATERASATLYEAAGDVRRASAAYASAYAVDPVDAAAEGLIRTRILDLDLDGAAAVRSGWWSEGPRAREVLGPATWRSWVLSVPDAAAIRGGSLWLTIANDQQLVAELPVDVSGPAVGLSVQLVVEHAELGAGLIVELVDPDGEPLRELFAAVWGQGGGGVIKLRQHCGATRFESIGHTPYRGPGQAVTLDVARLGPLGRARCARRAEEPVRWLDLPADPLPPGRYSLRLRAHGVPDYAPPALFVVRDVVVRATGVVPAPAPLDPAAAARATLVEGGVPSQFAAEDAAWVALAAQDPAALRRALTALVAAGDRRRVGWLLRRHGDAVIGPLEEILGSRFANWYRWTLERGGGGPDLVSFAADVMRPALDRLDPSDEDACEIRLWRVKVLAERGDRAAAVSLAETVAEGGGATPEQRDRARQWIAALAAP